MLSESFGNVLDSRDPGGMIAVTSHTAFPSSCSHCANLSLKSVYLGRDVSNLHYHRSMLVSGTKLFQNICT